MAVHSFQVTLGTGATPLLSSGKINCRGLSFQDNAAGAMRAGGPEVTTAVGIQLLPGGGSFSLPYVGPGGHNIDEWYVVGTSGQLLDVTHE